MPTTEGDALESRIARIEEALRVLDQRLDAIEHVPRREAMPPVDEEPGEASLLDFTLIGKSILVIGGAYLLRALTELGWLPELAGVVLAFLYAITWIAIAARAHGRAKKAVALFDAATGAMIAGALIFEATTRFHALTPLASAALTAIVAAALLAIAMRHRASGMALIAATMATFTLIGIAIGTADLLEPALAAAVVGVVAFRMKSAAHVTMILAIVSDFLAIALLAMTALDHTPHATWTVEIVLLAIAALWVAAMEWGPRWPESLQTAAALLIGAGGASLLAFDAFTLAIVWSAAAAAIVLVGRSFHRPALALQAPLWSAGATIAMFVAHGRPAAMLAVAGFTAVALTFAAAPFARVALLGIVTLVALAGADSLLAPGDAAVLAMERSVVLAAAAVLLALLGRWRPEAATIARVVLVLGGVKLLIEDLRTGRATTIVVALVAYGTALSLNRSTAGVAPEHVEPAIRKEDPDAGDRGTARDAVAGVEGE